MESDAVSCRAEVSAFYLSPCVIQQTRASTARYVSSSQVSREKCVRDLRPSYRELATCPSLEAVFFKYHFNATVQMQHNRKYRTDEYLTLLYSVHLSTAACPCVVRE